MLVLSRKKNESIDFPNLGISVEILRVEGKTVRVGVEAPRDIRVLRGELTELAEGSDSAAALEQSAREERHELRNRLNTANLALHLLQKQLEAGQLSQAETTLGKAHRISDGTGPLGSRSCSDTPQFAHLRLRRCARWWSRTAPMSGSCWQASWRCAAIRSTLWRTASRRWTILPRTHVPT